MSAPAAPRDRSLLWRGQRGTSLVELALILPLMLALMLTVVDLSRAFYMKGMLTSAAREGARLSVQLGTPAANPSADYDTVKARVTRSLAPVTADSTSGLSAVTVTIAPVGQLYKVTVSGNFNWLYLGILNEFQAGVFTNPQNLSASTSMQKLGG